MKLENSFSVRAPIDEVWAALLDLERVAPCLPGARVVDRREGDVFEIELEVALADGPVSFQRRVSIVAQKPPSRRAVVSVSAADDDTADSSLVLTLSARGEVTEGSLAADLALGAKAPEVEEAAVQRVCERLTDDFARNLAVLLGGGVATVNGADSESSTPRPPVPAGEAPTGTRPIVLGAAPAPAGAAEAAPRTGSAPAPDPSGPSGRAGPGAGDGSWAGATRQAGATIERLRSPLGVVLVLVLLGLLLGRRRARVGDTAAEEARSAPAPVL